MLTVRRTRHRTGPAVTGGAITHQEANVYRVEMLKRLAQLEAELRASLQDPTVHEKAHAEEAADLCFHLQAHLEAIVAHEAYLYSLHRPA